MVGPRTLSAHSLVGVDTSIFIYVAERHPQFGAAASLLINALASGALYAVASTLTIAELLVVPYRTGVSAQNYLDQLASYRGLELVAPDIAICDDAARLRAQHRGLKLPDAIHLATAISASATAFVTNDKRLPLDAGIEILLLADV